MRPLLIRADASTQMGTGHVMRCLALAQAWQDVGGTGHFALAPVAPALKARLRDEGFETYQLTAQPGSAADANETIALAQQLKATWVVVDGYHFDAAYQQALKKANLRLLVVDDYGHASHYYADLVLNQNLYAEMSLYANREPYTRLLLGPQYALLRREFWPWRGWQREITPLARKVLVTLGGSDPDNVTLKVVEALQQIRLDGLEAVVVVGNSNPHWETLHSAVEQTQLAIRLERNVTNMPELMAWADMAISAGGSTCWELAFMELPSVILILGENQQKVAEGFDVFGLALNLGWHSEISKSGLAQALGMFISDSERVRKMNELGQKLVDGIGVTRVISNMFQPTQMIGNRSELQVRQANLQDTNLLWQWANDPTVRINSFHPEPISLDKHTEWYKRKLASLHTRIWILELNQIPVAQIRYDRVNEDTAEIDFCVEASYRGRGLGEKVLALTGEIACKQLNVKFLKGIVFSSNIASQRAFIKANFENVDQKKIFDQLCHIFIYRCSGVTQFIVADN